MKDLPKVLLYGTNCASVINSLTIGFEKMNIPVKSLSFDFNRSIYNNYSKIECICSDNHPGKIKLFIYKVKGLIILIRYLLWCDVVHIYGTKRKLHYWLIAAMVKNKFVTFLGSEIRMPQVELAINPFYKHAFYNKDYESKRESKNQADTLVRYLTKLKYGFIVWDTEAFIDRKITQKVGIVPHASINMRQKEFVQKRAAGERVLIIHSPTAPVAKGTVFVEKAIEILKQKNIPFEFKLLTNLPNEEYQRILMEADIYVDQLIWGAYGVAAQQALQMGKVVVAYINPERLKLFDGKPPVQNATVDNLALVLERLIADKEMRDKISDESLLFYQTTHEPENVARKMLATYKKLSEIK